MRRRLTLAGASGLVALLFAASATTVPPAGAQDANAICVLDAGVIDVRSGSSGQGIESNGLIWRVSYQAQRVTALDPDTLEPVIDKALGQTSAAVLTPLSEVGGLIAVPISGPGHGAVQFLDARTGEAISTVDLGAPSPAERSRFHLVTAVVTIGDLAYVASGGQLTIIDIAMLTTAGTNGGPAVIDRIAIDHTMSELGVADDTLVLRELLSDRVWSLEASTLVPYDGLVPWSSVTVSDTSFALIGDRLVRRSRTGASEIDVIGRPTALATSADSLWVASRLGDESFVSMVDLATRTVTAAVAVEGPIWWLWATSETAFVETPDEALALTAGRCTP